MNGRSTVPIVLLGRYTTLAGSSTFHTIPVNVVDYASVELTISRGKMIVGGAVTFMVQHSSDRSTWFSETGVDPGADGQNVYEYTLSRQWLRLAVTLGAGGSDFPVVSCYAVGTLVTRR